MLLKNNNNENYERRNYYCKQTQRRWFSQSNYITCPMAVSSIFVKLARYVPRVIITDKLRSYAAAKSEILPGVEHRQHKGINNRAENSHQPTRQQKRQMRKFKSPKQVQRFLFLHGQLRNLFFAGGYKNSADMIRTKLLSALNCWKKFDLQTQCA